MASRFGWLRRLLPGGSRPLAAVQRHDLRVRGVDSHSGALRLHDGRRRAVLRLRAHAFADETDAQRVLSQLAAAVNGLRSTLAVIAWSERDTLAAALEAQRSHVASGRLTGGRLALARDHLAHLETLAAGQLQQADGQRAAAPRQYTYFLTLDAPDAATLDREAAEVAAAFRATRLGPEAASAVLAQGWRGARPLRAAPGEAWAVWRRDDPTRSVLVADEQGLHYVRRNGKAHA